MYAAVSAVNTIMRLLLRIYRYAVTEHMQRVDGQEDPRQTADRISVHHYVTRSLEVRYLPKLTQPHLRVINTLLYSTGTRCINRRVWDEAIVPASSTRTHSRRARVLTEVRSGINAAPFA